VDHVEVSVDLVKRAEVMSEVAAVTENAILFFVEHPAVLRLVLFIQGWFDKTVVHRVVLFFMLVLAVSSKMAKSIHCEVVAHL
jgi:hypothetical protein